MLKFVILIAILALNAESRYFENELVRTKWMDRKPAFGRRIVNGEPAEIADFPHMLALLDLTRGGFICGASIIHPLWSLTAAHCVDLGTPASQVNLRGGSTNRLTGGAIFFVQVYTIHPSYNRHTLEYDIGIIRVQDDTPMQGHLHVSTIPLSPGCATACCQVCNDVEVTTSGWGQNELGVIPINLQQLTKRIHDWDDCNSIWGQIGPSLFCKMAYDGRDTCGGDSGSPLITTHGGTRFQVGLVSFGTAVCGDGTAPSVNVRVEFPGVRNWITQMSGV